MIIIVNEVKLYIEFYRLILFCRNIFKSLLNELFN